jgi:lipopolysaccharide export LptBFGC system permease protein LptF
MKILDRYVIVSFLKNYAISFMVLVGMYVVLDMVFNFSNLVAVQANSAQQLTMFGELYDIGNYYFYQCFLFFVHLSGIIPVVAAAFTLMRLSRFNELTAMLAAGVPLLRIATPIIIVALVLNGLLLVDQELVIPQMIPKLTRDHDEVHKAKTTYYPILAMQAGQDLIYSARYFPTSDNGDPPVMKDMDVIEREPARATTQPAVSPVAPASAIAARSFDTDPPMPADDPADAPLIPDGRISAAQAMWDAGSREWKLTDGYEISGIAPDQTRSPRMPCTAYKNALLTPDDIALYRSSKFVELLSTQRIDELLNTKSYGEFNLLRVKYWRFTEPLMNVILLLLAIPCVLTREPGRLKQAAMKCLVLTGLAMGSVFLSQQLAPSHPESISPDRWALILSWAPIFIFGPISVLLLDRVKT